MAHLPLDLPEPSGKAIAAQIVALIASGQVDDGAWLPSTRALALELNCSRTMVAAAYDELIAAGFLEGVPGAGTRTTLGATAAAAAGLSSRPSEPDNDGVSTDALSATAAVAEQGPAIDLRPGYPDTGLIDMRAWTRAWRTAASRHPTAISPWEDTTDSFTAALTKHLRTNRGIDTDVVFDVPGSAAAFRALANV